VVAISDGEALMKYIFLPRPRLLQLCPNIISEICHFLDIWYEDFATKYPPSLLLGRFTAQNTSVGAEGTNESWFFFLYIHPERSRNAFFPLPNHAKSTIYTNCCRHAVRAHINVREIIRSQSELIHYDERKLVHRYSSLYVKMLYRSYTIRKAAR
jgi:hypothetical protein